MGLTHQEEEKQTQGNECTENQTQTATLHFNCTTKGEPLFTSLGAWLQCQSNWLQKYYRWLKVIQFFLRWRGEDGVEHRHHYRGLQGHVQRLLLLPLRHVRLGGRHQQHRPVTVQRLRGKEGKIFTSLTLRKSKNEDLNLKPVTILDWRDDSGISDNLFTKSDRNFMGCTRNRCSGSKVSSDNISSNQLSD